MQGHAYGIQEKYGVQSVPLGPVTFGLYFEDGILGPDPERAIVMDKQGTVRAASPLGYGLRLLCEKQSIESCLAYEPFTGIVYFPSDQAPFLYIEMANRIDHLAGLKNPTGFEKRSVSGVERLLLDLRFMRREPTGALVAISFWTAFWGIALTLVLTPIWLILSQGSFTFANLAKISFGSVVLYALAHVAAVTIAFGVSSPYVIGLCMIAGLSIATGVYCIRSSVRCAR